jgi:hypothetical protein
MCFVCAVVVFADLMNHSEKSSIEFFRDEFRDTLVFVFSRPVTKGQEVFLSYGTHSSSQMLLNYGFIDAGKGMMRLDMYAALSFSGGAQEIGGKFQVDVMSLLKKTLLQLINVLLVNPPETVPEKGSFLLSVATSTDAPALVDSSRDGNNSNSRHPHYICSVPSNLLLLLRLSHIQLRPSDVNHDSEMVRVLRNKNSKKGRYYSYTCTCSCDSDSGGGNSGGNSGGDSGSDSGGGGGGSGARSNSSDESRGGGWDVAGSGSGSGGGGSITLLLPGEIISLHNEVQVLQSIHGYLGRRKQVHTYRDASKGTPACAQEEAGATGLQVGAEARTCRVQLAKSLLAEEIGAIRVLGDAIQSKIQSLCHSITISSGCRKK